MPSCQELLVTENNADTQVLGPKSGLRLDNPQEDIAVLGSGLTWHFSYKTLFEEHLILFRELLSKLKPKVCWSIRSFTHLQCISRRICKAHAHAVPMNRALCSLCCLLFPNLAPQVLGILSIGSPVHPTYWSWMCWRMSDKKKSIYKCISGKRKNKENVVLLLRESGPLVTKDWETGWGNECFLHLSPY